MTTALERLRKALAVYESGYSGALVCYVKPSDLAKALAVFEAAVALRENLQGHYANAEDLFCVDEALDSLTKGD